MKKLILIAMMSVILSSCTSNKVQIFNNRSAEKAEVESMDGTMYEVAIYFYDDSDRIIKSITIGDIAPLGSSAKFDAAENAKYFKVEWCFVKEGSSFADHVKRVCSGEYTQVVKGLSVLEISDRSKILRLD